MTERSRCYAETELKERFQFSPSTSTERDCVAFVIVLPQSALLPHRALKASVPLLPHMAFEPHRALLPHMAFCVPTKAPLPHRALLPHNASLPPSVE